jgi:superfamily II DNA helicase RecQ
MQMQQTAQFKVCKVFFTIIAVTLIYEADIKSHKYQVIVMSPKLIINDQRFDNLWRTRDFMAHLFNIMVDERHCISQWGKDFHPEYSQLGRLHWLLPLHVPFHVVSVTLPSHILKDVLVPLNMHHDNTSVIRLLNDRCNIQVTVIEMLHSANSFHNINHILHLLQAIHPPKFMIFCNSRQDSQRMAKCLHSQLHPELQHKIVWFHSGMMQEFRTNMMEKLHRCELWGMCCMDAVGMVSSLHLAGFQSNIHANVIHQGLDI